MKQNSILLLIFSLFLFSCDNDDPVVIETNLPLTVPIEISEASATEHESGRTDYAFTASGTYYLSDNDDLKDQLDDISNIFSRGSSAKIAGLAEGDTVNYVSISIGESTVGINTPDSLYFTSTSNPDLGFGYAAFGDVLMEDKQVTVTVEGTTRKAPMNFDVNFELLIEAVLADEW
ncbi:hypothetical protein [uncultured Draconibacterium sp.]|uniref:hypothetical protein n=1 Tax=uncultured Draconibacterium sp. TaxID=1573823 RepID=UPI002AA7A990|nr:hypothetical protein [uncultured Draconibacterium sp.]